MKKILIIIALLLIVSVVTAAGILLFPYDPMNPPLTNDINSTPEGITRVVNANNEFTIKLYSELKKENYDNIFFSPLSIFSNMALIYEGSEGNTQSQMQTVFNFPEKNNLRSNFAAVYNNLNTNQKEYVFKTGNALWLQNNSLSPEYKKIVEEYYGGKAVELNFQEVEETADTINSFISQQTKNKINNLVHYSWINPLTKFIATNAAYFEGDWKYKFNKDETSNRPFLLSETEQIKVPTMSMSPKKDVKFNYAYLEDLQIIELPYRREKISMLIFLPFTENISEFESELSLEKINSLKKEMKLTHLETITLPKIEMEEEYHLKEYLKSLGMVDAWNNDANFSDMFKTEMDKMLGLILKESIHKSYLLIDEKGTTATSATATLVEVMGVAPKENQFKANHPFIFLIQDTTDGNILFFGRILNPTGDTNSTEYQSLELESDRVNCQTYCAYAKNRGYENWKESEYCNYGDSNCGNYPIEIPCNLKSQDRYGKTIICNASHCETGCPGSCCTTNISLNYQECLENKGIWEQSSICLQLSTVIKTE